MSITVEAVSETRHTTSQGHLLDRIVKAFNPARGLPVQRLRIEVYRDAYDQQSYARISVWDGTKWNVVTSLRGEHPTMKAGPNKYAEESARHAWQDEIAQGLLDVAVQVVL